MKKNLLMAGISICLVSMILIGCGGNGNKVHIGAIFPLSGSVAFYGIESRDGALLAVNEINASGGLLGKKITLISEDDEGNTGKTIKAFTKLTTKDKVSFLIGSSTSETTQAISELAQSNKVVLISPSATNKNVTNAGDYIFRACFIDSFQGIVGAIFAYDILESRTAVVLYDAGTDYNTGLAESFRDQFIALGGQVVAYETYQTGDVDFNAQVSRVRASNPGVIYLPNYLNDVKLQAVQLRDFGVTAALVGGDGWDGVVDLAGDELLKGYWSSGFAADTTEPAGKAFADAFSAAFNRTASQFAALGYDSVMLLADGIKSAGTFDTEDVKNAMAKIDGTYVTGNIRFDENRNPVKGAAFLEIVRHDGALVNVYKATINPR